MTIALPPGLALARNESEQKLVPTDKDSSKCPGWCAATLRAGAQGHPGHVCSGQYESLLPNHFAGRKRSSVTVGKP